MAFHQKEKEHLCKNLDENQSEVSTNGYISQFYMTKINHTLHQLPTHLERLTSYEAFMPHHIAFAETSSKDPQVSKISFLESKTLSK